MVKVTLWLGQYTYPFSCLIINVTYNKSTVYAKILNTKLVTVSHYNYIVYKVTIVYWFAYS